MSNPEFQRVAQNNLISYKLSGEITGSLRKNTKVTLYFDKSVSLDVVARKSISINVNNEQVKIADIEHVDPQEGKLGLVSGTGKMIITFNEKIEKYTDVKFNYEGFVKNRPSNKGNDTEYISQVTAEINGNPIGNIGFINFIDTTQPMTPTKVYKRFISLSNDYQFYIVINPNK